MALFASIIFRSLILFSLIFSISFKEILVKSRDLVSSWGGQLYFVYFPSFQKSKSDWQDYHLNKHDEVIKVVKSINLPIIDLSSELFSKHPDPLSLFPLRGSGHYNAKGYSEVARTIVSRVGKKEISK